ncbi:MAG: hypothetical protein EPN84_01005 [Legionella sp.]|nr:MAG: hypothetical protein EPN84_01005 [Legionella sp.]
MDKNHFFYNLCTSLFFCCVFAMLMNFNTAYSGSYGTSTEGGKIACLKSDEGIDNLIAAKTDISKGITWGGLGQAIGPSAQSDTDGMANTKAIVATLGKDSKYAALLCADYEIDDAGNTPCSAGAVCYRNWFLPARKQLDCVHEHRKEIGGFAEDFYWTSTEFAGYPAYTSWDKYFGDGEHEPSSIDDFNKVRCVRLFNP